MTLLDQLVGVWLFAIDPNSFPDGVIPLQADSFGTNPLFGARGWTLVPGFNGKNASQLNPFQGQFFKHLNNAAFALGPGDFTLAVRVKFLSAPTADNPMAIISKGPLSTSGDYCVYATDAGYIVSGTKLPGGVPDLETIPPAGSVTIGVWHLVVFGYDSSTGFMFASIDGAAKQYGFLPGDPLVTNASFNVGVLSGMWYLNGAVDDMMIWHRVLGDDELSLLQAGSTWPFGTVTPAAPAAPCVGTQCCDIDEAYSAATAKGCTQDYPAPTGTPTAPKCVPLTVTIDPPDGSVVGFPTFVILHCNVPDATIHYTTDGSTPNAGSPVYSVPFSIGSPTPIKVLALRGACDASDVVSATYAPFSPNFTFSYLCDTPDVVGPWGVFAPNGSPDYHWTLQITLAGSTDFVRVEVYQTNATGFWDTGQAWGTDEFINPVEGPANFHVFPLEIWEAGVQLNAAYAADFHTFAAGTHNLDMYGQPRVPLYGWFKVRVFLGTGQVLESIISTVCIPPPPPPCPIPAPPVVSTADCAKLTVTIAITPGTPFRLYRAVLPDCGDGTFTLWQSGVVTTNPQTFNDPDVVAGCTYCYYVSAQFPGCDYTNSGEVCATITPASCDDSIQPATVTIAGYFDGFFPIVTDCPVTTFPFNLVCDGSNKPLWTTGIIPKTYGCAWALPERQQSSAYPIPEVPDFRVQILASVSFAGVGIYVDVWVLSIGVELCGGGDPTDSAEVWSGIKACGATPTGTYTKISGCAGPATVTLT